ncbi:hypothetical protein [Pseudoroseomonas cervicalis]|uniref:hypothetical protein n=1 Tax=Teichococcus cervicalis TaxID=204525 RepID=UPI002781FD0B|nr:hypothetical protein [Pseudoroseomonas cervicalis]MDQ1080078.1 hypothetical protein [Pseudoroseomonas cervicalis]
MTSRTDDQPDAPLPEDVLRRIVGGTRPEQAPPLDGERAIALTVGGEAGSAATLDPGKLPAAQDPDAAGLRAAALAGVVKIDATPTEHPVAREPALEGFGKSGAETRVEIAITVPTAGSTADGVVKIEAPIPQAPAHDAAAGHPAADAAAKEPEPGDDPRIQEFRDIKGDGLEAGRHLWEWERKAESATRIGPDPAALGQGGEYRPEGSHDAATVQGIHAAGQEVSGAHEHLGQVQQSVIKERAEANAPADHLLREAQALHNTTAETAATTHALLQQAKGLGDEAAIKARQAAHDDAVANHAASIRHLEAIQDRVDEHKDSVAQQGQQRIDAAQEKLGHAEAELANRVDAAAQSAAQKAAEAEHAQERADELRRGTTSFLNKAVSEGLNEAARADAKAHDNYSNTIHERVTSGGVTDADPVKLEDGKVRTQHSLAQTTETSGSESWSSELGSGGRIIHAVKAEAGEHVITEARDADGKLISGTATKTYAEASAGGEASFSVNAAGIYAEASAKAEAHAEAGASASVGIGDAEVTGSVTVAAQGSVGAEAGFHLGYDGLVAKVEAKAEISVSATGAVDVKVGDVTTTVSATVFAEARASAHAEAEVTFDPTKGVVKAKIGGGAEASLGVGADVSAGGFTDDGHGASATGHFKAGAIGVKFEPDVTIKDGEVDIKLGIGGYLGIGGTYDIEIKGSYEKAAQNIEKANHVLEENPVLLPAAVGIYAWSAITGFFS